MSWNERECFGLAQYAHKYAKCPRERAKCRPTHIYRRTPLNRAVGLHWVFFASDRCVCRSCATHSGSLPRVPLQIRVVDLQRTLNFNGHQLNTTDTLMHRHRMHAHHDRRGPERVKPCGAATDAAQRPSLLCTEASLRELIDRR
jgi:hypothetical protein